MTAAFTTALAKHQQLVDGFFCVPSESGLDRSVRHGILVAIGKTVRRHKHSVGGPLDSRYCYLSPQPEKRETSMSVENKQSRDVKRSYGFLWFGGVIAAYFFLGGKAAWTFSSGSPSIIFGSLLGFALALGTCALWHVLSRRRRRRNQVVRAIGLTFFVVGCLTPMFMVEPTGFGGKPPSLDLDDVVTYILMYVFFLTPAYFLCFGARRTSPDVPTVAIGDHAQPRPIAA